MSRVLNVEERRLRYWQRLGLLPSGKNGFGWSDLARARAVMRLFQSGVAAKHLVPYAPMLERSELSGDSGKLIVQEPEGPCEMLSGQFLLDLVGESEVHVLPLAEEWVAQAEAAFDMGDNQRALRLAQGALDADPTDVRELNNLGILLLELDRPEQALETLRKALRSPDAGARQWFNLGHALEYVGHLEECAMALERALELDPDFADARFNLALMWERLGEMERAYGHWMEFLRRDPFNDDAERVREHLAQTHGKVNVIPLRNFS